MVSRQVNLSLQPTLHALYNFRSQIDNMKYALIIVRYMSQKFRSENIDWKLENRYQYTYCSLQRANLFLAGINLRVANYNMYIGTDFRVSGKPINSEKL